MVRVGCRKMIQGSPDHGMDENYALNPLEGFPEARKSFKTLKNQQQIENQNKGSYDVSFYDLIGVIRQRILLTSFLTISFVVSVTFTSGSLTLSSQSPKSFAAYFTGLGLLSTNIE